MTLIWGVIALIVGGIIIANLIVNPSAVTTFFGYVGRFWQWAVTNMFGEGGN